MKSEGGQSEFIQAPLGLASVIETPGGLVQPQDGVATPSLGKSNGLGAASCGDRSLGRFGEPLTVAERKREADRRHRAAGRARLHAWVPTERLADVEALIQTWGLRDRAGVLDVAIQFLLQHSRSMTTIELD